MYILIETMIFIETPLKNAWVIELEPIRDERGFFARAYCAEEFKSHNLNTSFLQANYSFSKTRGTLRGLHYQTPPFSEVKLVRCVKGAILDVIVDIRKDSQTFLEHFAVELSEDNHSMIYVPTGFAHGFITLTDDVVVTYQVSCPYTPGAEGAIRYNDPLLTISWPVPVTVISDKDKNIPFLNSDFEGITL